MKGTALCIFLFITLHAYSSERSITFEEISKINEGGLSSLKLDEAIQISGFLYKDSAHNIYLSNNPNLKSCCVGHFKEGALQIRVLDLPSDTLIKEGELRKVKGSLSWDSLETSTPSFYLKKSELMDKAGANLVIFVGAVLAFFFLSFIFLKWAGRHRKV